MANIDVSIKNLLIIEKHHHLELLSNYWIDNELSILVAISAEADFACECAGISYHSFGEFYSEPELFKASELIYQRLDDLCSIFDREYVKITSDAILTKFTAKHYRYHLKTLFDSLLAKYFALSNVVNSVNPERIIYVRSPKQPINDDLYFLNESLSARILPHIAQAMNIQIVEIPCEHPVTQPSGDQKVIMKRSDNPNTDKPTLLLTNYWVNTELPDALQARNIQIVKLDHYLDIFEEQILDLDLNKLCHKLWEVLSNDASFVNLFNFDGINLFPAISDRLFHFTIKVLNRHIRYETNASMFMKQFKNCLLLGNSPVRTLDIACFVSARSQNIPAVIYQHGIFLGNPDYKYAETQFSDYWLCYGAGEIDFAKDHECIGTDIPAQPVPVGSIAYDKLFAAHHNAQPNKMHEQACTILYPIAALHGDIRPLRNQNQADDSYWNLLKETIQFCCGFPNVKLIVKKFPPSDHALNPVAMWVKEQKITNCYVVDSPCFTDLLSSADIIITDIISSPIIEATATNKPIAVYANPDHFPRAFPEKAMKLLEKRVFVAYCKLDYFLAIHKILKQKELAVKSPLNNEFLAAHGTFLNDGKSLERAVDFLCGLFEQQSQTQAVKQSYACEEWLSDIEHLNYSDYWNDEALEQNKDVLWILDGNFEKMEQYFAEIGMIRLLEESVRVARESLGVEIKGTGCDIGAGNLWAEPHLFRLGAPDKIYCVEYSRHRLFKIGPEVLKHYGVPKEKVVLAIGDFHHLGLPDNSMDFLFLAQAFHHSDSPEALLAEMKRVIKAEGVIIMIGEHLAPDENREDLMPPDPQAGDHIYTMKHYDRLFSNAGFKSTCIRVPGSEFQAFVLLLDLAAAQRSNHSSNKNMTCNQQSQQTLETDINRFFSNNKENNPMSTNNMQADPSQEQERYIKVQTDSGPLKLLCPNDLCAWRAETFFSKEPETIEWITSFTENTIMWDIGANVGLYSLFAAKRGINVMSFEPSAFNYYILNRNIEANSLDNRIVAFCIAFNDRSVLDHFCMASTETGGAMNCFGEAIDYEGNAYVPSFRQGMLGYNIDEFVQRFNPPFPNHIKIDVDGIEDKIIRGAANVLKDVRLQSLLIELEEDRPDFTNEVIGNLARAGLQLVAKRHASLFDNSKYSNCYNYIFVRG